MTREGVRLACRDFAGEGPAVLLLHGLAGHAEEWSETAAWLAAQHRVVGLDARGQGHSERFVADVSRDALVADTAFVIERLELTPVVVVGQSVGGLTALSLAAGRPELMRGLVLVDASPEGGGAGIDEAIGVLTQALRAWPVPFHSQADAQTFFANRFGSSLAAEAWTRGLEHTEDGWRPRFDVEMMAKTLREALSTPSWEEWERITCPTLVVRAGNGLIDPETALEMAKRLPGARLTEIREAPHDVHLGRPGEWREALSSFLESLDCQPA